MNILAALRTDWTHSSASAAARHRCRRWRIEHPVLAPFTSPAEIVTALRRPNDSIDAILNALLVAARTDALARRTLVEAFLPAVVNRIQRVRPAKRDDALGEYLLALYEGIDRAAIEAPVPFPMTRIRRPMQAVDERRNYWARRPNRERPAGLHGEELPPHLFDTTMLRHATTTRTPQRWTAADQALASINDAVRTGKVTLENATYLARSMFTTDTATDQARRNFEHARTMQLRLRAVAHDVADNLAA